MLIFSEWRMAPNAIAYFVNARLNHKAGDLDSASERKDKYGSELLFTPLPFAFELNLESLAGKDLGAISIRRLRKKAEKRVREQLRKLKVSVNPNGNKRISKNLFKFFQGRFEQKEDSIDDTEKKKIIVSQVQLDQLVDVLLFSPANCIFRSVLRYVDIDLTNSDVCEVIVSKIKEFCQGDLMRYLNRRWTRFCIENGTKKNTYWKRVIEYCKQAHFQEVVDEFLFVRRKEFGDDGSMVNNRSASPSNEQSPGDKAAERTERILKCLKSVFSEHVSRPNLQPKKKSDFAQWPGFAINFGGKTSKIVDKSDGGKSSESEIREAFNSPFWPFVLASTSRGQEGLDFHSYCKDIVHWNLPTNPVDLEQREGRVNRFDSLAIRQAVISEVFSEEKFIKSVTHAAKDEQSGSKVGTGICVWQQAYDFIHQDPLHPGKFKHDLFPNWIFQGKSKSTAKITRHFFAYSNSKDVERYNRLSRLLAVYRMAFGQPRQEDFLNDILSMEESLNDESKIELNRLLNSLMIDLSPIDEEMVKQLCDDKAFELVTDTQHDETKRISLKFLSSVPMNISMRMAKKLLRIHNSKFNSIAFANT
ncbi:MAG: hypothetical protein R3C03_23380 [Pirellulaceae bacterium]